MDEYQTPKQKKRTERCTVVREKEKELARIKTKLDRALESIARAEATGSKPKIYTARKRMMELEEELAHWQKV